MKTNYITTEKKNRERAITSKIFYRLGCRIPDAQIAHLTGKNAKTIGNYRRKVETMPLMTAIAIANATGMSDEDWIALRGR